MCFVSASLGDAVEFVAFAVVGEFVGRCSFVVAALVVVAAGRVPLASGFAG